jgi:hypothetical protein
MKESHDIARLRAAFEAFNRGDAAALAELTDPEIVVYDAPELPGGSVHRGPDAVERGLDEFRAMFDRLRVEPERFVDVGNRVVVVFRATGRGRESGIPIDVLLANVFTMRDGRIVEWRSYTSPEQALESVELS